MWRLATKSALLQTFGKLANVIDTNLRAQSGDKDAFVDLISIGETYPLLGKIDSPQLPADAQPFEFLSRRDGNFGALVDPLMLDQLGAEVGDVIAIGGTPFEVRGALAGVPDGAVRGFRLGLKAMITTTAFANLSDQTSPLPGLGTWYRYKLKLDGGDAEAGKVAVEQALNDSGWTVRSARDGLGPMVRYYDLFMRFLVIVGLASLLIGGVSVWTGISAYVTERANVIAILRSMGASRARIFIHFFSQVAMLALIGVGIGLADRREHGASRAACRRQGRRRQPGACPSHPAAPGGGGGRAPYRVCVLLSAAAAGAGDQSGDAVPLQGFGGTANGMAQAALVMADRAAAARGHRFPGACGADDRRSAARGRFCRGKRVVCGPFPTMP